MICVGHRSSEPGSTKGNILRRLFDERSYIRGKIFTQQPGYANNYDVVHQYFPDGFTVKTTNHCSFTKIRVY